MPNWCAGKLNVRGKLDDIKRFMNEGINLYNYVRDENHPKGEYVKAPKGEVTGDSYMLYAPKELSNKDNCYVEETKRGFVFYEPDYILVPVDEDNDLYGIILQYQQAWAINADELLEIAKKYNLDFKITAFECGMEFGQEIEIVEGILLKNNDLNYENWFWDCPDPFCGG